MRKFNSSISFLMVLALFSQGCYTLSQIGSNVDSGIEITNKDDATSIKSFTKTKKINHFVYGLVSPSDAGVEKLITDEVKAYNGNRAVNVRMKYQFTFVDGLVSALTLGIYTPFTLTVTGDVVK